MDKLATTTGCFDWGNFSDDAGWKEWRAAKIRLSDTLLHSAPVVLDSLSAPETGAVAEIEKRCRLVNYSLFQVSVTGQTVESSGAALMSFARRLGLSATEDHRSAGASNVVALRTSSEEGKQGYIPYTPRPMNWHTDGYYNAPDQPVQAFILYCFQQAATGGENNILDPEIAYLRLRDENPDYVRALLHPAAMTIPENIEADGSLRPASTGPVFFPDRATGRLQMRYTARTRSIAWRDDPLTQAAADWLRNWLMDGDPLARTIRLAPGQGIASNNLLHTRAGFEDGAGIQARIMLRARFHERIAEEVLGAA